MRLRIRHEIAFTFASPVAHSIRLLRLVPRPRDGLGVESWRIVTDTGDLSAAPPDGFGNATHVHIASEPHARLRVVAEGEVEVCDTAGVVRGAPEPLPPAFYLRSTPRTTPEPALAALAAWASGPADPLERAHRLLAAVHAHFEPGVGVWADAVHVFVAAARVLGCPARYVTGYRDVPCAWAEVHVAGLGWVGVDPARGVTARGDYVACAVGLDAADAAAVRGVPAGAGTHDLTLHVAMAEVQQQ